MRVRYRRRSGLVGHRNRRPRKVRRCLPAAGNRQSPIIRLSFLMIILAKLWTVGRHLHHPPVKIFDHVDRRRSCILSFLSPSHRPTLHQFRRSPFTACIDLPPKHILEDFISFSSPHQPSFHPRNTRPTPHIDYVVVSPSGIH